MKLIKAGDKLFELNDDRLSPMTYSKLKEMGYTSEDWKDWDQEHANKVVAEGIQSSTQNKESESENSQTSATETTAKPTNKQISEQLSSKNLDKKSLINLYKQIDSNDVITVKNNNQHFEYIPKGDGKYAIRLHTKNGIYNGGQTTLSDIMNEHWKWIDPNGFYTENVTVDVTSKEQAEEQNKLQQTAEANPGRQSIKISQSQKSSLQKYADRFEYDWEDISDGINYRVTVMGMGVQEAVDDIKETMVAGEDIL